MSKKLESKYLYYDLEKLKEKAPEKSLELLYRAMFMQKTIKRLEEKITEQGEVVEMCQGAYSIDRLSPALQGYNNMIKNYTSVMKIIMESIPEESKEDEFDTFE